MNFILSVLAGLVTGVISGFGIGGGTILMVYLTVLLEFPQKTAQGINLLYFLPTAVSAMIIHSKNSFIRWKAVFPAALAGCLTAGILSLFAMNMDLALLKKLFGGFLVITGSMELFKKQN